MQTILVMFAINIIKIIKKTMYLQRSPRFRNADTLFDISGQERIYQQSPSDHPAADPGKPG